MNLINVEKAVELFSDGEMVIVPTDTVYGIACDYANAKAVAKVYQIKGRPEHKPMIVLISSMEMLGMVAKGSDSRYSLLMQAFWPGALTLIFSKAEGISDLITAGGMNIGVRMPANKEILEIIKKLGRPIVATSVNKSGSKSLLDLKEIADEFPGLALVNGGEQALGIESTVLDLTGQKIKILRPGAISKEQIKKVLGVEIF